MLPTQGVDLLPKTFERLLSESRLRKLAGVMMLPRCEACKRLFNLDDGYAFCDDFYCENCAWKLAEQGEFYSG